MSNVPFRDDWWQASDGKWYAPEHHPDPNYGKSTLPPPPDQPKTTTKVTGNHLLLVLGIGLALVAVFTVIAGVGDRGSGEPSVETQTRTALDSVWVGMGTSERVAFCADARASGYTVVVSELSRGTDYDEREVRYWLEDRCG